MTQPVTPGKPSAAENANNVAAMDDPVLPPGSALCWCPACRQMFARIGGFDKHRIGDFRDGSKRGTRRCRTPDEMRAAGMVQNVKGHWLTRIYQGPTEDGSEQGRMALEDDADD